MSEVGIACATLEFVLAGFLISVALVCFCQGLLFLGVFATTTATFLSYLGIELIRTEKLKGTKNE